LTELLRVDPEITGQLRAAHPAGRQCGAGFHERPF
jgi:hypothetical protein